MIQIEYFEGITKVGEDVIVNEKLDHRVIGLAAHKCIQLGWDKYYAKDDAGNRIVDFVN